MNPAAEKWRGQLRLALNFRLHALCSLSTFPAPPFDGQKSTRSRVHFKLNLFAGPGQVGPTRGLAWLYFEYIYLLYVETMARVIHYFDSLTSIHLVVLVACHFRFLTHKRRSCSFPAVLNPEAQRQVMTPFFRYFYAYFVVEQNMF